MKNINKKKKQKLTKRQLHLQGRNQIKKDFDYYLKEVQRDEPSIGGKVAGMDFRQFSAIQLFQMIKDQKEYVDYCKKYKYYLEYDDAEKEVEFYKYMTSKVKKIFGKDYKYWMKLVKE